MILIEFSRKRMLPCMSPRDWQMTRGRAAFRQVIDGLAAIMRSYGLVQDDAAIESLRRFLVTLWLFVPLEFALAWWFGQYRAPLSQPDTQSWANSLFAVHVSTAAITLLLALLVFSLLRNRHLAPRSAVVLQVLLCAIYLGYGAAISYIDLSVGAGISAFILICVGIGGLSLMRPAISAPLYAVSFALFWQMLVHADQEESKLTSLFINSFAAVVLALVVSVIVWHQYAKGAILRRQLTQSNADLRGTQRELELLAGQDPLTGLPNRRLLVDRLRQGLASSARGGSWGALLFIDLDNFKVLNDTRGHDVGDLLLRQVAERLSLGIRENDTVARLGGDEFVVMLEDLSNNLNEAVNQVEIVGEKILDKLNRPYQLSDCEHQSTASVGATLFSGHEQSVDELMKRADMAMYQAKAAGRNTVRFYDPEMQARVAARLAMESDLHRAIMQGQFVLYYQAQVDSSGRAVGAEVLVRWQHPERGLVSPAEFIPLAEETGLILPLGHWVLETACAQLAAWSVRDDMAHLTLAVNVSARQFSGANLVEQVLALIDQSGAPAKRLKLELTEGMLLENAEDVIAKMTSLKSSGVSFSLDDFGTGYSSLSYLKRLPLDQLKIDQSFVRDVITDNNDAAIATTIIALAQNLGLAVIAEGVETAMQRDFLGSAGCHAYQGYFFSRPIPLDDFERFVKQT
jgi:diguanylate cyclase (GGDEF)-like protein